MNLLPLKRETIVSAFSAAEVEERLWRYVFPVREGDEMPDLRDSSFLFNGWIKPSKFKISRRLNSPENFLPLIKGDIEETSLGSLIFIRYSLFFSANFFLAFWSAVTLFMACFFIFFYGLIFYACIAFSLGIGNYIIALANFNIQVKKSRILLYKILQDK